MSEWQSKKLGNFIKVKHGYAFKGKSITDEETDAILVTPGNFKVGGGFKSSKFKYFNSEYPEDYVLTEGDIVVTMTDLSKESDTLGYSAKIPSIKGKVLLHNQRIGLVEFTDNEVSKDFIYWLMRTTVYQWYCVSSASGTSIMHTSPSRIEDYDFQLPSPSEQKDIAEVLSCLDNKIDLLHRQNQTLEQMAETLFEQRFLEKTDVGWEKGILDNEFNFTMGQSPPGSSFNEVGLGVPMYQGNRDFGFRFPENRVFTTNPKRFAEKFDTLISVRAPVGEQNMAYEKCCIGRGVAAFRFKTNPQFYTYTYFKMKSLMGEIKQFNETGTVFGSISKSNFQEMVISIPPLIEVEKFQEEVKPIDDKIITNCKQIRTLTALRDTLLPKLMSGDVTLVQ